MKIAFAAFLFAHGVAHIVGFLGVLGIAEVEGVSGKPTLLITGLAQDHWLVRVLGIVWLLLAIGFAVAAFGVLTGADWTIAAIVAPTVVSTVMCLIWAKDTPIGFVANALVIAALVIPAIHDRVLPG